MLTLTELRLRQGLFQTVQRSPQKTQVADVQVHGSVEFCVGEAGLLMGLHVLLQVPMDLGQSMGLCCRVHFSHSRATDFLKGSFTSFVFLQHILNLLQ